MLRRGLPRLREWYCLSGRRAQPFRPPVGGRTLVLQLSWDRAHYPSSPRTRGPISSEVCQYGSPRPRG